MTHLLMLFFSVFYGASAEPELKVVSPSFQHKWSQSELLSLAVRETITFEDVHTYQGRFLKFEAIPLSAVLDGVELKPDSTIEMRTQDGYTKLFTRQRLIDQPPGRAYIAIETTPWPKVPGHSASAGPFYLIWKNASFTTATEWPYQLTTIEVKASLQALYPKILPAASLPPEHAIHKGFGIYKQYCMSCHTINGQGGGEIGPDLNKPSALSKWGPSRFFQYIRNPRQVYPKADEKMPSYSPQVLSDQDLTFLIQYLKHMQSRQ